MRYGARPDTAHRARRPALALLIVAAAACRPPSGAGVVGGPREEGAPRPEPAAAPAEAAAERSGAGPTGSALERVGGGLPEVARALEGDRASLLEALAQSLAWFEKPSSRDYYPVAGVTHERAWASVYAFRELMLHARDAIGLARWIHEEFEFYASAGVDGRGTVT
ncbi:MAG: hypothetical protein PVG79_03835, partial [Gemmatimonadales bacterium]